MNPRSSHPSIARNLTRLALLGAGLPAAIVLLLTLMGIIGPGSAESALDPDSEDGRNAIILPLKASAEAQALAVEARLGRLAYSSQVLAAYTKQVLLKPEVYAPTTSQQVPQPQNTAAPAKTAAPAGSAEGSAAGATDKYSSATDKSPAAADPAAPASPPADAAGGGMPSGAKAKLDNPIMYSQGRDGALRKVMDDGDAAVFYRSRGAGTAFTAYEKQRLYATAALDVLLKEAVSGDKLAGQAFILTNDSLLRTYPFVDTMQIEGAKDLTDTPLFAWSADKANTEGVVWTSPYCSWISGGWVVACLSPVLIGDKLVAVAGCEVSLEGVEQEVLTLKIGGGSVSWLQRPDGTLLAAAEGGEELLGVKALSGAPVPDEEKPAKAITDDANVLLKKLAVFADQLDTDVFAAGTSLSIYGKQEDGKYLALVPLPSERWVLGATLESKIARAMYADRNEAGVRRWRQTWLVAGIFLAGIALSLLLAWLEARRLVRPLQVLTHKSREIARSGKVMPLALSEESELGDLSRAMQDAVDSLARPAAESAAPDSPAASLLFSLGAAEAPGMSELQEPVASSAATAVFPASADGPALTDEAPPSPA
ncbi:hypothetical protein IT575_03950 [bacterium]|nr:hypothetical protein [bacterium]